MLSVQATQLREDLLHLSEDFAEHLWLIHPHTIGAKAEPKPPGIVKRVLLSSPEIIMVESTIFIILFVIIIVMGHAIKEGVPVEISHEQQGQLQHPRQLDLMKLRNT